MPKNKPAKKKPRSVQQEALSHPLVADSLEHFLRGDFNQAISIISTLESTTPRAPLTGATAEAALPPHLLECNYGDASELHSGSQADSSDLDSLLSQFDSKDRASIPSLISTFYEQNYHDLDQIRSFLDSSDAAFVDCPFRIEGSLIIADNEFGKGHISSALEFYQLGCVNSNQNPDSWNNLGLCHYRLDKPELALEPLLKACQLNPAYHIPLFNIGLVYKKLGDLHESERYFRLSIAHNRSYVNSYLQLAELLKDQSRFVEADCFYRLACLYSPDGSAEAAYCYGLYLFSRQNQAEAIAQFQKSISCDYELLNSLYNSALCHRDLGHFNEAIGMLNRCIELNPDNFNLHLTIGFLFSRNRCYETAFSHYQNALRLNPSDLTALSNLIYASNFGRHVSLDEEISSAKQWEQFYGAANSFTPLASSDFRRSSLAGRKLKLGILSSEIGNHAISRFLKPLLQHIDKSRFTIFVYQGTARNDDLAPALLSLVDHHVDASTLSDEDLTSIIRDDCIDILVETSAHMRANRLGVVCRRAAPIQMHYIGYHGTTGISSLDYIVADNVLVPVGSERQFTEKVARLNRTWVCYDPPISELPDISPTVSHRSAPVFGSFNNLEKISTETILIWSQLLKRYRYSTLLLKDGLATADLVRNRILSSFESFGINPSRIHFKHYTSSWIEHMNLYNDISIALDTYPLNSGTTAFDALAMGVPVVALQGPLMGSRLTSSILSGLGKPDWIASGSEDYIRIVGSLLSAVPDISSSETRRQLRALFFESSLCDGVSLAASISSLLVNTFNHWFDQNATTSLRLPR